MRNDKWSKLTLLVAYGTMFVLICTGCPAQRPDVPETGPPPIPESIAQEENREPELLVFIAETGETQNMAFEEYIKGVVAAEMDVDWPVEALAAQAILARTFTLYKIATEGGVPKRDAHASTDIEEFQAYNAKDINEAVQQAVEETRGRVMTYEGDYVRAWFHAYSGGQTALPAEGLAIEDEVAYLTSVSDPGEEEAPEEHQNWEAQLSAAEVREQLKAEHGIDTGEITSIAVAETGPSGRATRLQIGQAEVSAVAFRLSMGSEVVKSTWFTEMELEGDTIMVRGTGFGHGVGLSQWGAKVLAERGQSPEDIITHFFQNIEFHTVWE